MMFLQYRKHNEPSYLGARLKKKILRKKEKTYLSIHPMFPWWLSSKEPACLCRRHGLNPWAGKIPWRRKWQATPGFLPLEPHAVKSLVGYSPWGCKRVGHDSATKTANNPRSHLNNRVVDTWRFHVISIGKTHPSCAVSLDSGKANE